MSTWRDIWTEASALDRAELLRKDDDWLATSWRSPRSWLVQTVGPGRIAMAEQTSLPRLRPRGTFDAQRHFFLGTLAEQGAEPRAVFTTLEHEDALPDGLTAISLRTAVPQLPGPEADIAVAATAICQWNHRDRFCPGCGNASTITDGGFARWCDTCERFTFPRNDAAVIAAVLDDDDRILLGHQKSWGGGRVSVLAGFVESGESLEQAVHREIGEEVGVRLREVSYLGSQPWPYPRSLMVAYFARAADTRVRVDDMEIVDADWFTREQVARVIAAQDDAVAASGRGASGWPDGAESTTRDVALGGVPISLPGPGTIARRLIEAWLADEIGLSVPARTPGSPDAPPHA